MLMRRRHTTARLHARAGLTLIELLIVIVLLSIVVGGIMGVILKQQQFYTGASGVLDTRSAVRQGINVLQSDLRAIAPKDSDIYSMDTYFVQFRQEVGASTVCTISSSQTFTVPGASLANRNALTAWLTLPQQGDSVLIYDTKGTSKMADDVWRAYALTANVTAGASCPTSSGLTSVSGEVNTGYTFNISGALSGTIATGSAIRIFRPARYELYQASDNNWYLGFKDYVATRTPAWSDLAPVSGPYRAKVNSGAGSGMQLVYYDSTGAATTNTLLVRRIDVVMRAQSTNAVNMPGLPRAKYSDSLATSIAVRN